MNTTPTQDEPIIIFVVGVTGTGKSTFIKKVTGLDVPIGDDLESHTHSVSIYKTLVAGKETWFVDTPGFNDTNEMQMSDTMVLTAVSAELVRQHKQGMSVTGVIYLHRITDDRMFGTALNNLHMLRQLVGEASLANVTLVTTKWDLVDEEAGIRRERQLKEKYWSLFMQYGAKVARTRKNDRELCLSIVYDVMRNMGATLQIQKELGDQGLALEETAAGQVVLSGVIKTTEEHARQLKEVNDELRKMREKGEQDMKLMQQHLEDQKTELLQQLKQAAQDRELLQKGIRELQQELTSRNTPAPPPPIDTPAPPPPNTPAPPPPYTPAPPPPQSDNINKLDSRGGFPLYWSACGGHYNEVKRLLEAGANASMRTRYDWTALHWAVNNRHDDIVRLLLKYNADVNAVSDQGRTPLSMAKTNEIRQLLRQHGAK